MNPNQDMNSVPSVLGDNRAIDENQDTVLTSIRLEPNSNSQIQSNFILPKNGSVLDSNSSLVWSISWDGYDATAGSAATADQLCCLKNFSGGLNSLQRARLYVGGRLLFTNPDVGLTIHLHKLSTNPDHYEEVEDKKLGSNHGFDIAADGKIASGPGVDNQVENKISTRQIGKYNIDPSLNMAWECTVLLSDIFPALKHFQIPIKYLKEQMRVEIDWNTTFDETILHVNSGASAITDFTVSIQEPLLYLDYLTYNEEVEAGLLMSTTQGMNIPYREINLIQKQLPAITAANSSQDIFLGFQGKLLMKIYVSHKFSDQIPDDGPSGSGGINARGAPYARFNGRCRSDMGQNFKYNLSINDLSIHDSKVDSASQQYSFLSMTAENPIYAFPNSFDYNSRYATGIAATDISAGTYALANAVAPTASPPTHNGLTNRNCRDGIAGTQAFIGFDLSKYGVDGGLNPANAGFRVGTTPIILNIEQDGAAAGTGQTARRQNAVKQIDVICESIKIMSIRNGMVDVLEA